MTLNDIMATGKFAHRSFQAVRQMLSSLKRDYSRQEPDSVAQQRKTFNPSSPDIDDNYFEVEERASSGLTPSEIIEQQLALFVRKEAHHKPKREGIEIRIPAAGPFAVVAIGDPHMDDLGCDFAALKCDLDLIKTTPHCFGLNMGDLVNNWARALGHLYAHQKTTDDEALDMVRWMVRDCGVKWLMVILGNHCKWTQAVETICKDLKINYASHGAMLKILRGDSKPYLIDARHTHPGNSMYNPSHGQVKRSYRGSPADVIIGAHTHTSALTILKNGISNKLNHCLRVGTYKRYDDYADAGGYTDECISPSVMIVIDPDADERSRTHIFHDLNVGAIFLASLRTKFEKKAAA